MSDKMCEDVIAIDFGTTYSRVAVWKDNNVKVIPDKHGNLRIPSCVAFDDNNNILVGHAALAQAEANPKNTVFAVKRLIGRKFNNSAVAKVKEHYSFAVVEDKNERPMIQVECGGQTKNWAPEQIAAFLLLELTEMAQTYLGKTVKKIVLTVPTAYCAQERRAMLDAANIAGLKSVQLISDTKAAVTSYKMKTTGKDNKARNVIFLEFGGGGIFASLQEINKHSINVKRRLNWHNKGGEDFTECFVNRCAEEFKEKNNGKDVLGNPHAKQRLRIMCEEAKCRLSTEMEVNIELDNLIDGISFRTTIPRVEVKEICDSMFDIIMVPVEEVLLILDDNEIVLDEVVFLGGSLRIPKVQQVLSEFFGSAVKINTDFNTDEFYVLGAATQAFIENGGKIAQTDGLAVPDVSLWALDIRDTKIKSRRKMIIEEYTPLPAEKNMLYTELRAEDFDTTVNIVEGGINSIWDYGQSSTLDLSDVFQKSVDPSKIEIIFSMDASGALIVCARDENTEKRSPLPLKNTSNLEESEVERMIKEMIKDISATQKQSDTEN